MTAGASIVGGASNAVRLRRLLDIVGLPTDSVQFVSSSEAESAGAFSQSPDRKPLIIELGPDVDRDAFPQRIESLLARAEGRHVLFFGPQAAKSSAARSSTGAAEPIGSGSLISRDVAFAPENDWGALCGLRGHWALEPPWSREDGDAWSDWTPLITIDGFAWFLQRRSALGAGFLCGASELPDVCQPLTPLDEDRAACLLPFLPFLFFLRRVFRTRVWHPPAQFANFIIDDPPVRDRYGYFSPERFLAALEGCSHATTIAFIPWNWNRSRARASRFFRTHTAELALCVHGCDHTGGEFASLNESELASKCKLALDRIRLLHQRTAVPCQSVMVFPQGLFSKVAMSALRETGFLGAVNSTLIPVDAETDEVLVGDLLRPAHTSFDDFPLFLRRYPYDPALCAVDLYLGRPLLVVEHHEYFRDGYRACRHFMESVNRFCQRPEWTPVAEIVRRACWQRYENPEQRDVLYFGDTLHLENPTSHEISYRLLRRLCHPERVREVRVNGEQVDHSVSDGHLVAGCFLNASEKAEIQLVMHKGKQPDAFSGTSSYRARVWLRRMLSDLRDNYPFLGNSARWVKRRVLPQSGTHAIGGSAAP
jgi:hypothetical protein